MSRCLCPDICGLETSYRIAQFDVTSDSNLYVGFPLYVVPLLISECQDAAPEYTRHSHQEVATELVKLFETHLNIDFAGLMQICRWVSEYLFTPCLMGSVSYNMEGKRYRLERNHVIVDNFRWKCSACTPSASDMAQSRQIAQTDAKMQPITVRHDDWHAKEMLVCTHNPLTKMPLDVARNMLMLNERRMYARRYVHDEDDNFVPEEDMVQVWLHSTGICETPSF